MRVKPLATGLLAGFITFALLFATAGSIGVAWDEPIYSEAAERAARWFGLFLRGEFAQMIDPYTFGISWGLVNEHPPLLRMLNGLGWALTRDWLPAPLVHRLGSIALAALSLGVVVGVTSSRRGARVAFFAGAALIAMPRLFLHMHLGVLDFALAAIWIMGTLIFYGEMDKIHQQVSFPTWRPAPTSAFVAGTWLGLGLLTKINAVLLLPYWGIWLLCYRRTWRHLLTFALALPLGLLVLVAGWPWIWKDPIGGLWHWVEFFRVHFEIRQWFAGQLYLDTPLYLPPVMVLITTPVLLILLAAVGIARGEKERGPQAGAARDARRGIVDDWTGLHLLGLTTVLGYYALPFTPIHDQDRLLLPAFVHLAILSGDGFDWLWSWLEPRLPLRGRLIVSLQVGTGIVLLLPGLVQSTRLHPYQLAYYNELVGGVAGARRLDLETIYFATTYEYFLPDLDHLPANAKIWVMPNSWDVLYYYQLHGLLRRDLVVLRPPGWGSFYDDQGVPFAIGGLADADYALIERRQTSFNNVLPDNAIQLIWATDHAELNRLVRDGVILATLHRR
jgi:hypothetical protein